MVVRAPASPNDVLPSSRFIACPSLFAGIPVRIGDAEIGKHPDFQLFHTIPIGLGFVFVPEKVKHTMDHEVT